MIVILRRKTLWLSAFLLCFFISFSALLHAGTARLPVPASAYAALSPLVVIDAGHGGEDGGAVSADGVAESGINLAIALKTEGLLRFFGVRTELTRREDVSLARGDLSTVRERKADDLRRRAEIVNAAPNAVLLSIHQNSLPSSSQTHGAQAFWNREEGAQVFADAIQGQFNRVINTHRAKDARPIPAS
ncbi:MAG: N-acetylmuramoyl-L-alanine amidase, partial [Oscillibacter sp.]|nr:N-acetylmuramoyl-L-alanine amidase [Oscillibacter sp.]